MELVLFTRLFYDYTFPHKMSAQPGNYFRKITINKIHTAIKYNKNILTLL